MTNTTVAATATTDDTGVLLSLGRRSHHFSWRWLRDHGEDPASRNSETLQRRINVLGEQVLPATGVTVSADRQRLELAWHGEPTTTWISLDTFEQLLEPHRPPLDLWRTSEQAGNSPLEVGDVAAVLVDDVALLDWLAQVERVGFGLLRGFDGGHEAVDQLIRRVAYPRATIFDAIWTLSPDHDAHDDTAYSYEYLAPHTDGTYSHDAPGLQMFCCVERSGDGGESLVVDGFAAAEDLRIEAPEAFDLLSRVDVPAHYIEPGVDLRAARPAIRCDRDGRLRQVSFNPYDRSPMALPPGEMEAFYDAYSRLQQIVTDPIRQFRVRLEPGDVLLIDNWRALHGRAAYRGRRVFHGCYANHEDFESRLRVLRAHT